MNKSSNSMEESPAPGARILVIEDEENMRMALRDCLLDDGYRVLTASDGDSGLEVVTREQPDAVVLDVMLPKLDGFELCRRLREREIEVPVLMLTARGQIEDRVTGLDAGADDYLVKPCNAAELRARVRALLRRFSRAEGSSIPEGTVEVGRLEIDFRKRICSQRLTPKEFAMLELMFRHRGEVVSRERFLDVVWGYDAYPTTRTVDNHVSTLRAKIETDAAEPKILRTVHGVGYRLLLDQENRRGESGNADL